MTSHCSENGSSIWSFVARAFLVAGVPVAIVIAIYLWVDPFYVVGDDLLEAVESTSKSYSRLSVNKGLLSLSALDRRVESGDVPDSFIFGASISCYYEADYWMQYIPTSTTPMHFDSSSEGAESMRLKLEYLARSGVIIKHALIVIDPATIEYDLSGNSIMSADPPRVAGLSTWPRWHLRFFKAFYDPDFMITYLPGNVVGSKCKYGRFNVFEPQPIVYDVYRNEESIPEWDEAIKSRPEMFYAYREMPEKRELHCSNEARIDKIRENEYRRIARLVKDADYHVIVSPMIDLDTLSGRDDALLREIFGADRYHNFTVEMANVALCDTNWYDCRHYRAPVARKIIDRVYRRD